jgi:UDP:flavonoid glycosyltransferase YjiC (YdhE family)
VATLGLAAYLWPWSKVASCQDNNCETPEGLRAFRYGGQLEAYRQACEQLGHPVRDDGFYLNPLLGDLYLLRSVPGLAPEIDMLPEQVHLVGDCLWEPEAEYPALDAWLQEAVSSGAPVIYVQQGRAFGWHSFWQSLMGIASSCRAWFVASTGRMDQDVGALPKNVLAMPHAPQQRILPFAHGVICSGNTTAVLGALTHGIPSLLLPVGGEQPELADRCLKLGVSLVLAPETISALALRAGLEQLLEDDDLPRRARRLRDEFRGWQGTRRAAELLEDLARSKNPVLRCGREA